MSLVTLAEAERRLGIAGNRKLARLLIREAGLEPVRVGTAWTIPESDLPALARELKRWQNRPRVKASA